MWWSALIEVITLPMLSVCVIAIIIISCGFNKNVLSGRNPNI